MNKKPGIITLAILFAFALSGISCNRDKVSNKGISVLSPEQAKMVEAKEKSIAASKKTTAAKVNSVNISMNDLLAEMNAIAPQYIKPGQKRDPKVDEKVRKDALDRLIYRELAVQEAARQGMKVPLEKIGDEVKKVKTGMKSEQAYRENLMKSGLTEEELKKQIERNLLIEMITEKEIFEKAKIDPEQVKKAYAKGKASYKGPSWQMSFEEARPLIEQKLMTLAVNKREDEWVDELKKAAKIEITLGQSAGEIHSVK
jgi:hypothetical protein